MLQSPLLARVGGLRHAFFTRHGGVSEGLYRSLNVGRGSADSAPHVEENRRRAAAAMGAAALHTCHQVHSSRVVVLDADGDGEAAPPRADGLVTAEAGRLCGALAADCAPILLVDPAAGVVGAVHAGWRGALAGVAEAAVAAMTGLGARPGRILAAVGPCIGPASYEVGPDFVARFAAEAPGAGRFFAAARAEAKSLFDLPAFVLDRLDRAGVGEAEWIGRDTAADEALFSHRRATRRGEADYGRLLSAIMRVD